jgi:hypothetical protein
MNVPETKEQLLAVLSVASDRLLQDLSFVPKYADREKSLQGYNHHYPVSPAQMVADLIGWTRFFIKLLPETDVSPEKFPALDARNDACQQLSETFYEASADTEWPDLIHQLELIQIGLFDVLSTFSNDDLYGTPWCYYEDISAYSRTRGQTVHAKVISPGIRARHALRSWLEDRGIWL